MTVNAAYDCSANTCVRWSKYSTPRLTVRMLPVLRVCAMFEGLTEFCFVFRFIFCASLLAFTSRIERLDVATTAQMYEVFWRIFVANTVAHAHWQAGQVRSSTACVCRSFHDATVGRSAVRAQPLLLQRLKGIGLSHAVHWCVTHHYRQAVCSELWPVVSHSRHNAGDRSTKVGHEIMANKVTDWLIQSWLLHFCVFIAPHQNVVYPSQYAGRRSLSNACFSSRTNWHTADMSKHV